MGGVDELEDNPGLFIATAGWRGWMGVPQTLRGGGFMGVGCAEPGLWVDHKAELQLLYVG